VTVGEHVRLSAVRSRTAIRYRDVLRVPRTPQLLAGALVGRLPTAMAPLAILLNVASGPGHGTLAGLLAALYLVANAVGAPLSARLADRHGLRRVLTANAAASGAALLALAAGPPDAWWAPAAVTVAGACRPPLDAALRALWSIKDVMPSSIHRRAALALDSTVQEINYIVGPLLVAAITALSSVPWVLVVTAAVGALGTALFVSTAQTRTPRVHPASPPPGWTGPIRVSRLKALYLAMTCVGVTIGALPPLAVETADRLDAPGLSGGLPAALSCGAVLGGLLYGVRTGPISPAGQLALLTAGFAVGWLPLTVADRPATALCAVVLPGLAMAPLLGTAFVVTSTNAPAGRATETHALLVASLDIGCAIGTAVAYLTHTRLLLPAGAAAAALILAAFRRHLSSGALEPSARA